MNRGKKFLNVGFEVASIPCSSGFCYSQLWRNVN